MRARRSALVIVLVIGTVVPARAVEEDGGRPGEFLRAAASARSLSMARANLSVPDGADAMAWNASGLALVRRKSLITLYSALPEESDFGFAAFALPLARAGTLGFGILTLRSDGFTRRDATGAPSGEFDHTSTALLLSYGLGLGERWNIGGTVKALRQSIASFSGTGAGLDLGLGYRANDKIRLGGAIRNLVSPSVRLRNASEDYPREIRGGVAYTPVQPLLIAFDLSAIEDGSLEPSLGAEYRVSSLFAIRAGLNERELSAGAGVTMGDWGLDYAFGYHPAESTISGLDATHRLGLHLQMGPEVTEGRTLLLKKDRRDELQERLAEAESQLKALRKRMDKPRSEADEETAAILEETQRSLRAGLYRDRAEAYEARGYLAYFAGRYRSSIESLEAASRLKPGDKDIKRRLDRVKSAVAAATRPPSTPEIKRLRELYEKKDWNGTIAAAERILTVSPGNDEAARYMRQALENILEPRLAAAQQDLENERYVDAFIEYQRVLDFDPENQKALSQVARVSKVIEWKADMESATRKVPDTDRLKRCLKYHRQGLRHYSVGEWRKARSAWENALPHAEGIPLAEDAIKSALIELRRAPNDGES